MLHVFIINSFAGKGDFSDRIRNKLEQTHGIEYLVFNSEYPGHESVLAGQIYELFTDEEICFYSCGGSGTFRNIMKGLPDYDRARFVEVPCGGTNDFLAVFGKNRDNFNNFNNLIEGKTVGTDYIDSNLGPAHNTVSLGFDVELIRLMAKLRRFGFIVGNVSYAFAGICVLFLKSSFWAEVVVDGKDYRGAYEQITIANGSRLGGTFHLGKNNNPWDGSLDVIMFPKKNFFSKLRSFFLLMTGNEKKLSKYCIRIKASEVTIRMAGDETLIGNFDGEIEEGPYLHATVKKAGMSFVIPKGTEL